MKKTISIPYSTSTVDLHIEEENLKAVIEAGAHGDEAQQSEEELVQEALAHPIGSKKLSELAVGKKKVVIVTSDHTRAVPSKITLPLELREIRKGNPDAEITILIATGLHRATTQEEQRRMFGDAIVDHERIVVNDAYETADFVDMGRLPSGAVFYVNKLAAECDLLICEGFIEPHFFAGFSGGRKSILPGICSQETVKINHSYQAVASPYARAGILEQNPIHEDMLDAAVETIRRYRMVNEEEFKTRQYELERKYDDLEDSYKKKCRKQEAVIEQLSSELRACQTDEK